MNDFTNPNSEFDQTFKVKLDQRWPTMRTALNILNTAGHSPVHILETGCQRLPEDYGAGCSTFVWAWYIHNYGSQGSTLFSVDNDAEHLNTCKAIIYNKYHPDLRTHWEFIPELQDSIEALKLYRDNHATFEFIYLDSFDANIEDRIMTEQSQEHQLSEAQIAIDLFSKKLEYKVLLLDDAGGLPFGGKTVKTREFLYESGWTELICWQQSLWIQQN